MSKVHNILNGWRNFMIKSEVSENKAVSRAKHCERCKHAIKGKLLVFLKDDLKEIQGYKCNVCKCPLSAKLRSINEKCPIGKW